MYILYVFNKVFITVSSENNTRNIERADMSQYCPPEISRFLIRLISQERIKGTEKASPIHTLFHR